MANFLLSTAASPPPDPGESTVTITRIPADPYVGENVHFRIEGDDGRGTTDWLQELVAFTDVDDATITTRFDTGYDATTAPFFVFNHCYSTAGTKTPETTTMAFGGESRLKVHTPFEVTNIEDAAGLVTYWVDLNGSTAGMPTEDASNIHVLSQAELDALGSGSTGGKELFLWRGGVDHTYTFTASNQSVVRRNADVVAHKSFGTGNARIVMVSAAFYSCNCFAANQPGQRLFVDGVDCDGGYSAKYGMHTGSAIKFLYADVAETGVYLSMNRCNVEGAERAIGPQGTSDALSMFNVGMFDCRVHEWQDYAFTTAAANAVGIRCNILTQPAFSGLGDGRAVARLNWGDHGPGRANKFVSLGVVQNFLVSCTGWANDDDIQALIRVNVDKHTTPNILSSYAMNTSVGAMMVQIGRPDDGDEIFVASRHLVACNNHIFASQDGLVVDCLNGGAPTLGGIVTYSNLAVNLPLESKQIASDNKYAVYGGGNNVPTLVDAAATAVPCYVSFNTYASAITSSLPQMSVNNRSMLYELMYDDGTNTTTPFPATPSSGRADVAEGNAMSGEGHPTNSPAGKTIPLSAFSIGDGYKVITGSALDTTATSGPPVDITGATRSNPTQIGAYHTKAASAASGTDIVYSGGLAIGLIPGGFGTGRENILFANNEGSWTYSDPREEWCVSWSWSVNGTPEANRDLRWNTWYDISGLTTDDVVTLTVTRIGLNRVPVTATASYTVP